MTQQSQLAHLIQIKTQYADQFFTHSHVTGVGVGSPTTDSPIGLMVYVKPGTDIQLMNDSLSQQIQREVEHLHVVERTFDRLGALTGGALTARIQGDKSRLQKHQPMQGGIGCGPDKNMFQADWHGTMGLIVTLNTGVNAMLSAGHVMAYGEPPSNTQVCQPARVDTWIDVDVAGDHLNVFIGNIASGGQQVGVDAAVATVSNGRTGSPHAIYRGGIVTGHAVAKLNDLVNKTGITTDMTSGRVSDIALDIRDSEDDHLILRNQICVEGKGSPFCAPGDSGSVVVTAEGIVVGLLWGQTSNDLSRGVASPIAAVMLALNFNI